MSEIWFDTQAGELLVGTAASEQRLAQSGPQVVVPLGNLLQCKDFPYVSGDFPLSDTSNWGPDEYITFGQWALTLVAEQDKPRPINREHFRRLRVLGLGPPLIQLGGSSGFNEYKDLIGAPLEGDIGRHRSRFRDTTLDDIVARARQVANRLGDKISQPAYGKARKRGDLPSEETLYSVVGGLRRLNDLIGFPDLTSWGEDTYINFGLDFLRANGAELFVPAAFDILGKRHRGPWPRHVIMTFGKWSTYKEEVLQLWIEQEEGPQRRLAEARQLITEGRLPSEYADLDDAALLRTAGRYRIVQAIAPGLALVTKKRLAIRHTTESLARQLQALNPHADAGYFEMIALSLGVFDDVYGIDRKPPPTYIRVQPEELEAAKAARRLKGKTRHQRSIKHVDSPVPNGESARDQGRNNGRFHATTYASPAPSTQPCSPRIPVSGA